MPTPESILVMFPTYIVEGESDFGGNLQRVGGAGHVRGMQCTHMNALLHIIFGTRSMRVGAVWNGPNTTVFVEVQGFVDVS